MSSIESLPRGGEATTRRLADELPNLVPNLDWAGIKREVVMGGRGQVDLVARARIGKLTKTLLIEVKSIGEPRIAEQAITHLKWLSRTRPNAYPVFAAPYVGERAREICKSQGVGYIDLVGNVYLRFDAVLIDKISGAGKTIERKNLKSLLAPKATRVIRALLESSERPTRIKDLADSCSMSPAGVYFVVNLLENKGFVSRGKDRRVMVEEPERLLREWAKNWSMEKNQVARYFSFEKGPDQIIPRISETAKRLGAKYAFTGMAGASFVAPFVRYGDVWLYASEGKDRLIQALDLRPVWSGANVVILSPYDEGVFAGAREIRGSQVVNNVQLFVDLFNYPARGQEQAEEILARAIRFARSK